MDAFGIGDMDDETKISQNQTIQFESPTHTGILLCGLNNLRNKNLLVDVTLIADGQPFEAHRVVLASISDYFRVMFTSEVKESHLKEITLEGVSAKGMEFLLDYAYSSRLSINLTNIQDILSTASHVQVLTVVEACSSYLQAQLDLDNAVDIVTLAETYSLHQLKKRVYRFICSRLMEFSQTPDFQRLSVAQLEYLLSYDVPVDCTEAEVLQIILQWIEFDTSRMPYSLRLLSKVHFEEIPPDTLNRIWDYTILHYICDESNSIYKIIASQVILDQATYLQMKKPTSSLVNPRGMELAVVKVGGFGISGVTNDITYFLPSIGRWKHLTTIPHVEQCNFGMAVLNNQLYVVGGCFNQCLQENIHPFGFSYDPRFDKWSTMAPMLTERCRFTLNVVDDKLYAIGGASENVEDVVGPVGGAANTEGCSCESYNSSTDSWTQIAPLSVGRTQHAGTAWNNFLFISGGLEHDVVSNCLLCYNTVTNEWKVQPTMLTARGDHSMVVYKDKLYVCGGWCEDEATGNRFLVSTIDEYDILKERWSVVTEVPTPRYHAGVTVVNQKLHIVGGFHSDATFDRTTGVIECFDLETGEWGTVERYPQDIWEHVCATLYIPRSRDDMDVMPDIPR